MRKVIVSNFISLDGFIAGPKGKIDWFTGADGREYEADAMASADLFSSVDTMLFGLPVVLGQGKPLFNGIGARFYLKLVETRAFRSGLVLLRYEPDHENKKGG